MPTMNNACSRRQNELNISEDEAGIRVRTMNARADLIGAVFVLQPNPTAGMQVVVTLDK